MKSTVRRSTPHLNADARCAYLADERLIQSVPPSVTPRGSRPTRPQQVAINRQKNAPCCWQAFSYASQYCVAVAILACSLPRLNPRLCVINEEIETCSLGHCALLRVRALDDITSSCTLQHIGTSLPPPIIRVGRGKCTTPQFFLPVLNPMPTPDRRYKYCHEQKG